MRYKSLNLLIMGILIAQPVEAHRKHWDDTAKNPIIVESNDATNYNITSEGAVTKKKDNAKKSSSSSLNKNIFSKEDPTMSKDNSSSTQMPTAIKGVGIPGSRQQAEVPHAAEPKDNKLKKKASKNQKVQPKDAVILSQFTERPQIIISHKVLSFNLTILIYSLLRAFLIYYHIILSSFKCSIP